MRNSHRDGRKNGKFEQCYLGPYRIAQHLGKGVYKLESVKTGKIDYCFTLIGYGCCSSSMNALIFCRKVVEKMCERLSVKKVQVMEAENTQPNQQLYLSNWYTRQLCL